MRYRVFGVDASTNKERCIEFNAISENDAICFAKEEGLFAYRVEIVTHEVEVSQAGSFEENKRTSIPRRWDKNVTAAIWAGMVFLVVLGVYSIMSNSTFGSAYSNRSNNFGNNGTTVAIAMAKEFVKERLKSPSSASFPWSYDEYTVTKDIDGRWRVSGYVDAVNSFNAKIRTSFLVEMRQDGESWRPTSIYVAE
jgi:hypothetical protein